MLRLEYVFDLYLEILADESHAGPQMNEVMLTFAVVAVAPDHAQDHVPYFQWQDRMRWQAPEVFASD